MEREEDATARESEQERRRTRWRRGGARNDEAHTELTSLYPATTTPNAQVDISRFLPWRRDVLVCSRRFG
jgi:hypothetical protein